MDAKTLSERVIAIVQRHVAPGHQTAAAEEMVALLCEARADMVEQHAQLVREAIERAVKP